MNDNNASIRTLTHAIHIETPVDVLIVFSFLVSNQPLISSQSAVPPAPLTPAVRSKYLQQFHSIVDVTKAGGYMTGLQAKTILQQTSLAHGLLHQIWYAS